MVSLKHKSWLNVFIHAAQAVGHDPHNLDGKEGGGMYVNFKAGLVEGD